MSYRIDRIEGIGRTYRRKLSRAGIRTTAALLDRCADPKGRRHVQKETGIGRAALLRWVNLADLMRIRGIGPQYSDLLEAAGVDTVRELRCRDAKSLASKVEEANRRRRSRRTPRTDSLRAWIRLAKRLRPRVTY